MDSSLSGTSAVSILCWRILHTCRERTDGRPRNEGSFDILIARRGISLSPSPQSLDGGAEFCSLLSWSFKVGNARITLSPLNLKWRDHRAGNKQTLVAACIRIFGWGLGGMIDSYWFLLCLTENCPPLPGTMPGYQPYFCCRAALPWVYFNLLNFPPVGSR